MLPVLARGCEGRRRPPSQHRQGPPSAGRPSSTTSSRAALTPRSERDDVVQRFGTRFKKTAKIAGGLANALLVLDEGDAHVILAIFAEATARRHCNRCLLHQKLGELHAAEGAKRFGDCRP